MISQCQKHHRPRRLRELRSTHARPGPLRAGEHHTALRLLKQEKGKFTRAVIC